MGLDMYAYEVFPKFMVDEDQQVDLEFLNEFEGEKTVVAQLAYWRKFHQLHGWMERLYRQKGGQKEFNCTTVRLMPADLLQLALDASNDLAYTQGFFFGHGEWTEESKSKVLDFCVLAKKSIDEGHAVYYDSWG